MNKNTPVEQASSVYIPMDRRQVMARGLSLPEWAEGAALFADISGFTPLTEALARALGPRRGAEELARQLNLVYDALVAEVDRYGGSVIGFSGDAITCWFDDGKVLSRIIGGDAYLPAPASWRAVACGLAMQQAMKQFAAVPLPGQGTATLAMKASVASGLARRFYVGDPAIQLIDVVAGATLERMAAGEHTATRGEVVADQATIACLGQGVTVREWRVAESGEQFALIDQLLLPVEPAPWPPLPPGALDEAHVRPWVLPPVFERLHQGLGEFLMELRPAVPLFLRFGGIDYDHDEQAVARLDAYIRWVQSVVERYEGTFMQLTLGDKGSYFYVAFGAPFAHEDDARRAISASLELKSPPRDFDFISPVQIGISQGTTRTGAYGGVTRRTYGVLGDEVNLAARLMQRAAPGETLVSERAQRIVAEAFRWEALPAISVKGKSEPVQIYHPLGERKTQRSGGETILIGRIAERAILMDRLQKLARGVSGIIIVEGDAGIGKSHLVDDLRQQAEAVRIGTFYGAGDSIDKSTPYYAWRSIFAQLFDIGVLENPETQRRHLLDLLEDDPEAMRLAPLLNAVLPFELPDNDLTAQMSGQVRADNTRQLLVQFLRESARRSPKLVILENCQWLDSLSWELAVQVGRALIATGLPLLLILVTRPLDETAAGVRHLAALRDLPALDGRAEKISQVLRLTALSPQETVAVATARLGLPDGGLPEAVAELVQRQAGGNPFFAQELVFTLRDQGIIVIEPDPARQNSARPNRCRVSGDLAQAAQTLPDTVQGLILARIDRLPPETQLTLKVAAVIGRIFAYSPLLYTLKPRAAISEPVLRLQLESLSSLDLTSLYSPEPDLTYIFEQSITQEVTYQTLLFAQRRELHQNVAEWYEANFPDRLEDLAATLAYHYSRAGAEEKAIDYLLRAGSRARRLYALQEAIEHYQQALALVELFDADKTIPQRQMIHAALGELLTMTGQYEQALAHLQNALTLAERLDDRDAAACACRWLARLHELRGEYPAALEWTQRGMAALGERETAELAELLLMAGLVHTDQGNYDSALGCAQEALRIAQQLDSASALARAFNLLAHISRVRGQLVNAIEYARRTLDLYQRLGDISGQALAHNQIANAYFSLGQWKEAEQNYYQAHKTFDKIGDIYRRSLAYNNLGGIALNQGRLDEALALYQEGLGALERIGASLRVQGVFHMNLGATFVRRGDVAAARQHLETSREYFQQTRARDFLPELHRHCAEAALLAGELDQAEAQGRQALDLARELAMRGEEGNSLRVLGQIAAAQNQPALAQERLQQSIAILDEVGDCYEKARSQLALASLYASQANLATALEIVEQCISAFEQLGAELDLSLARRLGQSIRR